MPGDSQIHIRPIMGDNKDYVGKMGPGVFSKRRSNPRAEQCSTDRGQENAAWIGLESIHRSQFSFARMEPSVATLGPWQIPRPV